MRARVAPVILIALALSACAIPEARLRAGLMNAGLSRTMAACMAERMVDRLSLIQLRRIGDLPRASSAGSVSDTAYETHRGTSNTIRVRNPAERRRASIRARSVPSSFVAMT